MVELAPWGSTPLYPLNCPQAGPATIFSGNDPKQGVVNVFLKEICGYMDKRTITAEYKRLEALLKGAGVPEKKREALAPLMQNMAWQKAKLDEAREEMKDERLIDSYDNGGGQSGTRENPFFKSYLNLWRGYLAGLEKFTSYLPEDMQEEQKQVGLTLIDQVKQMKKKA